MLHHSSQPHITNDDLGFPTACCTLPVAVCCLLSLSLQCSLISVSQMTTSTRFGISTSSFTEAKFSRLQYAAQRSAAPLPRKAKRDLGRCTMHGACYAIQCMMCRLQPTVATDAKLKPGSAAALCYVAQRAVRSCYARLRTSAQQLATCNMQHAACNMQPWWRSFVDWQVDTDVRRITAEAGTTLVVPRNVPHYVLSSPGCSLSVSTWFTLKAP